MQRKEHTPILLWIRHHTLAGFGSFNDQPVKVLQFDQFTEEVKPLKTLGSGICIFCHGDNVLSSCTTVSQDF